jgi:hypothetical protein
MRARHRSAWKTSTGDPPVALALPCGICDSLLVHGKLSAHIVKKVHEYTRLSIISTRPLSTKTRTQASPHLSHTFASAYAVLQKHTRQCMLSLARCALRTARPPLRPQAPTHRTNRPQWLVMAVNTGAHNRYIILSNRRWTPAAGRRQWWAQALHKECARERANALKCAQRARSARHPEKPPRQLQSATRIPLRSAEPAREAQTLPYASQCLLCDKHIRLRTQHTRIAGMQPS